jgi:hypothetical protein
MHALHIDSSILTTYMPLTYIYSSLLSIHTCYSPVALYMRSLVEGNQRTYCGVVDGIQRIYGYGGWDQVHKVLTISQSKSGNV